jgi:alpha-tubulin suppressor-like RCC1 family protein
MAVLVALFAFSSWACSDDASRPADAGHDILADAGVDADGADIARAERLELRQRRYQVTVGAQVALEAIAYRADGSLEVNPDGIVWETEEPDVAVVDPQSGILSGLRGGETTVNAHFQGLSASATVVVECASDELFQIIPDEVTTSTISHPTTLEFTAIDSRCEPADIDPAKIHWSSSNVFAATVSDGEITPVEAGVTTITGQWNGVADSVTVTVKTVDRLKIVPDHALLEIYDGMRLDVEYYSADGTRFDLGSRDIQWESNSPRVASVTSRGILQAHHGGPAEIVARSVGLETSAVFRVKMAFVDMECTMDSCCAIGEDAHLYCMGENRYGKLGVGDDQPRDYLAAVDADIQFESVDMSRNFTCGLDTTGRAYCWGVNEAANLGIDQPGDEPVYTPTPVATNKRFVDIETLECGVAALTSAGTLLHWGAWPVGKSSGYCVTNSDTDHLTPKFISAGPWDEIVETTYGVLCVRSNTNFYCMGSNGFRQLGQPDLPVWPWWASEFGRFEMPGPASSLTAAYPVLCALDPAGHPWCAGENRSGLLGYVEESDIADTRRQSTPQMVPFPHTFDALYSSGLFICGTKNGEIWCWGENNSCGLGRVPSGPPTYSHTPVRINGLPANWTRFTAGGHFGCVLTADGQPWCWGMNYNTTTRLSFSRGGYDEYCDPEPHPIYPYPEPESQP